MITCGLMNLSIGEGEPAPVPLTGVSVKVRIVDLVAEIDIEQRYVNRENQPIEAVYKFPLDEGAAVCSFTAEVDGRTIQGVVKETEEATTDYEEAIRSGHTAFLLEEKLPDVFKAKVGNLAAGSGAKIRISYVTELKVEGGEIRFYLPTTIAPRYIPTMDTSSVTGDLASIKYTSHSDYKVEFEASVNMASAIKDIRSPTHKITSSKNGVKGIVKLDEVLTSMDRDLVLYIQVTEPYQARLIAEKYEGSAALMLSLVPSFKLQEQKVELIFVVDRSGSMQGAGIEQAKKAMLVFLHSLPVDCYVNILGFGSAYHFLFPVSRKYDAEVLKIAKDYILCMYANLGGTEIFPPLEALLAQPTVYGYLRQIFILTDGAVSNPDQVISLVRRQSGKARVFALGLGSSASHHLVEGIARAGNGTALFASLEERLEKKVIQQLQDALQPSLTNVKVSWDGYEEKDNSPAPLPVQTELTLLGFGKPLACAVPAIEKEMESKFCQAPCDGMIPPVFDGRHLVVYALLKEGARMPLSVKLVADSPAGPLSVQVHLSNPTDVEQGLLLHRLAAKKTIQLLEDRQDDYENCKKEIIRLGCTYGLASRYTSYVAVDPKEPKNLKEFWMMMKSRDVPVQVAHGWGGRLFRGPIAGGTGTPKRKKKIRFSPGSFGAPQSPQSASFEFGGPHLINSSNSGFGFNNGASSTATFSFSGQPPKQQQQLSPTSFSSISGQPQNLYHLQQQSFTPSSLFGQQQQGLCGVPPASALYQSHSLSFGNLQHQSLQPIDLERNLPAFGSGQPLPQQQLNIFGATGFGVQAKSANAPSISTDDDKLILLISTQSFDGAFQVNFVLAQLLNTTLEDINEEGKRFNYPDNVWFTLVALSFMTAGLPQLRDSWICVANKAEIWLLTQQPVTGQLAKDCGDWLKTAKEKATLFVNAKLKIESIDKNCS